MKNIWLFAGIDYYACGGLQNLIGTFPSEEEAADALRTLNRHPSESVEWYQIVDVSTCSLLRHYGGGGYGTNRWLRGPVEWPGCCHANLEDSGDRILCAH